MKYSTLEKIYESMLVPVGSFSIETGPAPESNIAECDEELTEEQEVSIARKIQKLTYSLDDIASEAHVQSYRRRIEDISEDIRQQATKLIRGHSETRLSEQVNHQTPLRSFHSVEKTKKLHPFPKILREMIQRGFKDSGLGWFSSGDYDDNEIKYLVRDEGYTVTDGRKLKSTVVRFWGKYEELIEPYYGKEVLDAYIAWKADKI